MTRSCKIVVRGAHKPFVPGTRAVRVMCTGLRPGLAAVLLTGLLAACTGPPRPTAGPSRTPTPGQPGPHLGRPYDVVPSESLLTILAYRAGALAKMGHNHVIASHEVSGTVYVADNLAQSSVEIHLPVLGLTVDEASLRAKEGSDFSAAVPDDAKDGTRKNMLSEALLDGAHSPQITLRSTALDVIHAGSPGAPTASATGNDSRSGDVTAHLQVTVRQSNHDLVVPVHYEAQSGEITVSGEVPLKQSDLGLTPFSAMLGALQVQDEMRVKFRFVARATSSQAR